MERSYAAQVRGADEIKVCGFVENIRNKSKMAFIVLKDITGKVQITEALGEVTLLYLEKDRNGTQVIAKLPGIRPELRHQEVRLTAKPEKVHLFTGGRSLLYR